MRHERYGRRTTRRKTNPNAVELNASGKPKEHYEQRWLIQWIDKRVDLYPDLRMIYAVPNGGDRSPRVAAMMKLEGVRPGVCDLVVAVRRKGYAGLYIEMKERDGGTVRPDQKAWIATLRANGYRVEVCAGYEEAREVVCWYLDITDPSNTKEHWGILCD